MSKNHNIDKLFQESFQDFEVDAPKNAWDNIEKRLAKKSKKPLVPLWQKLGGAAAVIAILILISSQWLIDSNGDDMPSKIVDAPKINNETNPPNEQNTPLVINTNTKDSSEIDLDSNLPKPNNPDKTRLTSSYKNNLQNPNKEAQSSPLGSSSLKNQKAKLASTPEYHEASEEVLPNNRIAVNAIDLLVYSNNTGIIQKSRIKISSQSIDNNKVKTPSSQKQSLVEVAKNIEKITTEKQKESKHSWFVKPQISPVYYGNLGSGSAVDPNLSQNSSRGEVNMSYGVNVAYQLNDKIKLRTGINRVNLTHTTNDVFLIPDNGLASLSNINANADFNASVLSRQQLNNLNSTEVLGRAPTNVSELNQELGYVEIPLEVEYKLIDKKLDVNLIGGASTLLLNNNNLDIRNINGSTSVGQANNINNLSFSTNLAIGFGYDITKRLIFNLEPTFKYQINTFQSNTTNFQPYFLGVYSGVIFRF